MLPSKHIFYGFLFSLFAYLIFPQIGVFNAFVIFLSSFLIDFDHYLVYVFYKRKFSVRKAYRHFVNLDKTLFHNKSYKGPLVIFHTVEVLALLLWLSIYNSVFLFISIGMIFHWLLDIYTLKKLNALHAKDFSIIYYYLNKKSVFF